MNKKKVFVSIFVIILCVTICVISIHTNSSAAITFEEAYAIAYKSASEWSENSMLSFATSVDLEDEEYNSFERTGWNFDFAKPETSKHYIIEIRYKDITSKTEVKGLVLSQKELSLFDIAKIDSIELFKQATEKYSLHVGQAWAKGYHLQFSFVEKEPIIAILGDNGYKCRKIIYFSAISGTALFEQNKNYQGGGLSINGEIQNVSFQDNSGVIGINPYSRDNYLLWGYTDINSALHQYLLKGGEKMDISQFAEEEIIYAWYLENEACVYVATNKCIYKENDNEQVWEESIKINFDLQNYSVMENKIFIWGSTKCIVIDMNDNKIIDEFSVPQATTFVGYEKNNGKYYALANGVLYFNELKSWDKSSFVGNDSLIAFYSTGNVNLLIKQKQLFVLKNDSVVYSKEYEDSIYNVYVLENNDFAVVLQNGMIYKNIYLGDDEWDGVLIETKFDGFVSNMVQKWDKIYICTMPKSVWITTEYI